MMKRVIAGVAIGAGLMYLFDPRSGKERRERLRGKIDDARSRMEQRFNGDGMDTAEDYSGFQADYGRAPSGDARDTRDRAADAAVEALSGTLD